jgi:hypothetical protein
MGRPWPELEAMNLEILLHLRAVGDDGVHADVDIECPGAAQATGAPRTTGVRWIEFRVECFISATDASM